MNWNKWQKWELLRAIKACLERFVSSINEPESVKESEKNFNRARTERIKKDFHKLRDRLAKPKIKEIRKDLYRTKHKKKRDLKKLSWIRKESF